MASEILSIPEEYLHEVIAVIRAGLIKTKCSHAVRNKLTKWCNEEEQYLKQLEDE